MEVINGIFEFSGVANCYIVKEKGIFLVDTGMPGNSSKIINYLEKNLKHYSHDLETIVITHNHLTILEVLTGLKR